MTELVLKNDKKLVIKEMKEQNAELLKMIESEEDAEQVLQQLEPWRVTVSRMLDRNFSDEAVSRDFLIESKVILNKLSVAENTRTLRAGLERTNIFLENLIENVEAGEFD